MQRDCQPKYKGAGRAPKRPDPFRLLATMPTRRGIVLMLPGRPAVEVRRDEVAAIRAVLRSAGPAHRKG